MGILLYAFSLILSSILLPIGYLFGFFKQVYKRKFFKSFKTLNLKFKKQATSIDRYGNIVCAELLDATLIKKTSAFKFGNDRETISSVIGRNKQVGMLTKTGILISNILDWVDKNHSIKSIGY